MSACEPCTCGEALSRVYDYLDQECEASMAEAIAGHLQACPPCAEQYRLVHRTCCEERAPEELRVRIVARISEVRITYRRQS
jgi:mycothiol system anti-sigma-R factor